MEEDFLGNALYTLYGDSSIEADELGNLFVNFRDTSYYTTAAGTKGDWLLRQYGESIIVRDDNGIAYARAEDGDWYISSLPRVNADTNPLAATNRVTGQEQAGVEADILNQDLNYALADAKPASGNAALAKEFYERWQYNYEIRVGPANPATVRDWDNFDIGSATPEEVAQYYEVQDAKQNSLVDTVLEMLPVKGASNTDPNNLAAPAEASKAEPNPLGPNKLYALAGISGMLPYSPEDGDPTSGGDYFSIWRMVIFGHDNPELANNQFKKAVDDTIFKDIYPLMLNISKGGVLIAAGSAGWYAPGVAATGNFVIEAAKNKSENYDRSSYTWEDAFVEAGKKTGIDLAVGMGAKEMSKLIAAKFSLPESATLGLEKGIDYLLKKGIEQTMEK